MKMFTLIRSCSSCASSSGNMSCFWWRNRHSPVLGTCVISHGWISYNIRVLQVMVSSLFPISMTRHITIWGAWSLRRLVPPWRNSGDVRLVPWLLAVLGTLFVPEVSRMASGWRTWGPHRSRNLTWTRIINSRRRGWKMGRRNQSLSRWPAVTEHRTPSFRWRTLPM